MSQIIQQKSDSKLPKYHPFTIPPSLPICYLHRDCSQFGKIIQQLSQQQCPCCNSPPRRTLKIGCKATQIYDISESVGYYFTYIKIATFALIIVMLITGIYSMVQIINQCSKQQTSGGLCLYVYGVPIPKIHIFFKVPFIILNGVVIIVLYILAAYLFYRHTYLHQRNLHGHQKSSDYSILLSGVDHKQIKVQNLRQYLEEYQIQDIVLTHKIKKYMKWLSKKSLLDAQLQRYIKKGDTKKVQKLQQQIKQLQNLMLHTKNKLTLGQDTDFRTDKIIITFHHAHKKKSFEEQYGLSMTKNIYHSFCGGSPLMINEKPLFIQPLGEPNQIIWQNFQYSSKSRYLRVLISNLVTILLLLGSFVMIIYLSKGEKDQDKLGDVLMSLLFAVLIQIVNEALNFAIEWFTKWEGRYTLTGQISMKMYKACAAFFLNSTLLPFLLFILDFFEPEQDDIIRNIFSVFIVSNLVSPYVGLFMNPRYLIKLYQRNKIVKLGSQCLITQIKANEIFQKNDFILNERYAIIAKLYMNCIFYAAIFPIGIIITIVGMFITFWSSKWWILNYCSLPRFSFRLGRHMNIITCLLPTIYALGYMANLYMLSSQTEFNRLYSVYMLIATIPITIIFILFGENIAKYFLLKYRKSINEPLEKKKKILTYKKLNPTSFLHDNVVSSHSVSADDIWANLVSYATAKQSGILNDYCDETSSHRSSKLSLQHSLNN